MSSELFLPESYQVWIYKTGRGIKNWRAKFHDSDLLTPKSFSHGISSQTGKARRICKNCERRHRKLYAERRGHSARWGNENAEQNVAVERTDVRLKLLVVIPNAP